MDKKSVYFPVSSDIAVKPSPKKVLPQGSLKSIRDASLKSQREALLTQSASPELRRTSSVGNTGSNGDHRSSVKARVICHSPHVVHTNILTDKYQKVEKIQVDVPPTIFLQSEELVTMKMLLLEHPNMSKDVTSTSKFVINDNNSSSGDNFDQSCKENQTQVDIPANAQSISQTSKQSTKHVTVQAPTKKVTKRKKPMVKVVESRYKSNPTKKAAPNNSSMRKSTSTSKLFQKSTSKQPQTPLANTRATPQNKTSRSSFLKAKASTPSAAFKSFFESDVSHIAPNQHADPPNAEQEVTQIDLDVAYGEYIRARYLRTAMEKAAAERSAKVLPELSALTSTNIQLKDEIAALEEEVRTLEHNKILEDRLHMQINCLAPVVNKLSATKEKYEELSENIDTTRHGLPLTGVIPPEREQLEKSLSWSKKVFGNISALTRTHADVTSEVCQRTGGLRHLVEDEVGSLNDVDSLVRDVSAMTVKAAQALILLQTTTAEGSA